MPSAKPISKTQTGFPEYLDFRRLREEGIRQIQKLSGDVWTDHNLHDPGITILEVLCYALLDLGYRTNLPINELLAQDPSKSPGKDQFFTAAEILSNNPLTITDYRKLLVDIRGVRNAWLAPSEESEVALELDCDASGTDNQLIYSADQPNFLRVSSINKQVVLNGLWKVMLELDPVNPQSQNSNRCENDDASVARILDDVKACLHQHRNLCEDFFEICVLQDEQIAVCAHLEIGATADPEDVLVDLFERLRDFLSPALSFYTLETMLEKGKTMEEIFAGRPYRLDSDGMLDSHGFIDTEELENLVQKTDIHASDVLQVMMNTPGIDAVSKLLLFNYIDNEVQTTGEEWCLKLRRGYRPFLAPELSKITLFKDGVPFSVNMQRVIERYTVRLSNAQKTRLRPYELDKAIPGGLFHPQLGEHYSIQHDFPNVYGIQEGGIPDSASAQRKAQAMQLKGYLLFFDQILANYLAQLAHVRDFFALRPEKKGQIATFYPGGIQSIPDLNQLIRGAAHDAKGEALTGGTSFYQQHELIAIPCASQTHLGDDDYLIFHNPQDRDNIILRSISMFENEEATVGVQFDADCQLYRFTLRLPIDLPGGSTGLLLRSAALFESEAAALREGESLTFLGLGAEHYRPINRDQLQEYTFELFYNPRDYNSILKDLAETPAEARSRRSRFLDHLLARFAEDFSEYALLQFKFGTERAVQETNLITAKENFLADYPDISRNRGKGFDYTDREHLWDTENVTGLERRVSSLMGIEDWQRRTLSPFAVESKPLTHSIELKDFRGRVIFESKKKYVNPVVAWPEFSDKVKALAADPDNYRPIDCGSQGMFSFQLVETMADGKECVVACHPDTYCCAADRDAKMAYVACLFKGAYTCPKHDTLGYCVKIKASYPGFHFSLVTKISVPDPEKKKNKTIHIYIRGAQVFEDKNEALVSWINFLEQVKDWVNYTLEKQPFSQNVMPVVLGKDGQVLARLAEYPVDEAKGSKALLDVFHYLSTFEAPGKLFQSPTGWAWHLGNGQGGVLLESLYRFETREQATQALDHALELAALTENLHKQTNPDGSFGYQLLEQFPAGEDYDAYALTLAQSPANAKWDESECNIALLKTLEIAGQEASFYRRGLVKSTALQLNATDAEGQVLLQGCAVFLDLPKVEVAWEILLKSAEVPENFNLNKEAGIEISLLDNQGKTLAIAPQVFYSEAEALDFVALVVKLAKSKALKMDTVSTGKVFNFQLTDVNNDPLLKGETWFLDKQAAQAAYYEALYSAKTATNLHAAGDGKKVPFHIALLDDEKQLIGTSLEPFADAAARDAALTLWRDWFGGSGVPTQIVEQEGPWNFSIYQDGIAVLLGPGEFPTKPEAALAFETALMRGCDRGAYRCFKASDACRFSFELLDDNLQIVLATHPFWYETEKECNHAIEALVLFLTKNKLPYEIIEEKLPKWHYELCWESCEERIESVLIGQVEYNTEAEAQDAMCLMLENIGSASIECQELEPCSFGFALKNGIDMAIHPRTYGSQALCACVIEDLKKYVEKVNWMAEPKFATGVGSYFKLLKSNGPFAKYDPVFSSPELRDEAWDSLLETITCGPPEYSAIDLSGCAVIIEDGYYYYQLMCGKTVWWRSCKGFDSAQEAMEAFENQYLTIIALASDPENYQSKCDGEAFCYYWLPDPTDPTCTRCIVRTEKFPADADLKTEFTNRLKWARTYPIFKNPDGSFSFKIADPDSGELIWLSTATHTSISEAQHAFEHFLALLCFVDNYQKSDNWTACRFGIELAEAGMLGTSLCFKEVLDNSDDCGRSTYFSDILLGNVAIEGADSKYYYVIRSSEMIWWRSVAPDKTPAEALNTLQREFFNIIEASADPTKYVNNEDQGSYLLQLKLHDATNLLEPAVVMSTYNKEAERTQAQAEILLWAKRFPIFKISTDIYSFRIFYPGTETVSWTSTVTYKSYSDAKRAFLHFLSLYPFKEQYEVNTQGQSNKNGDLPTHSINVGTLPSIKDEGKKLVSDPDRCWKDLETCLASVEAPQDGSSLFTHFMPEKDCRWGLAWALDTYRLARAPQVYHTPTDRECAREDLFHAILCSCSLTDDCAAKWYSPKIVLTDCCRTLYDCKDLLKPVLGCEILHLLLKDCMAIFPGFQPGDALHLPWKGGFGLLQFEVSDECCILPDDARYINLENMIDLMALARAEECYVQVQDGDPADKLFLLGLLNAQNKMVAMGYQSVKMECWEALKQVALEFAWEYPLVRRGDKFGFQLTRGQEILLENIVDYDSPLAALEAYCKLLGLLGQKSNYVGAESGDCGPFAIEVVDKSKIKALHPATYACRADAEEALTSMQYCLDAEGFHVIEHILLRPKTPGISSVPYWQICVHGQPVFIAAAPAEDISDTGKAQFLELFFVMLKAYILGKDALTAWTGEQIIEFSTGKSGMFVYSAFPVCFDALTGFLGMFTNPDDVEACLSGADTIGDTLFEACVDPNDCRNPLLPVDCIPGADPYSFWATVTIPWWGSRFRNLDFRHFVEKTLRREAPAHVGLRIGWLGAKQMSTLETQYREWLENNALGDDSCARQGSLNALMETMKNLVNVYPPASLHDCDAGGAAGALVLLDQTALGAG